MTVSTYLEAFLSVYGWAVYRVFFLLLLATGLFLYPILRAMITIVTEYLSGEGYDGVGYIKQAIATVVLTMAVFYLAMVPVVQISFEKMEVSNICGRGGRSVSEQNDLNGLNGKKYFTLSEVRVPLLPWLAMRLGQGVNAVIYKQLPCALHTGDANKTVLTLETNDQGLDNEFAAFINQCHRPAVAKIKEILEGRYDQKVDDNGKAAEWLKKELDTVAQQKHMKKEELINYVNSPFIIDYMYSQNSKLKSEPAVQGILDGIPDSMKAQSAVAGFSGSNINGPKDGIPTCYSWWQYGEGDANKSLRNRLIKALTDDAVIRVSANSQIPECKEEPIYSDNASGAVPIGVEVQNKDACLAKIREKVAKKHGASDEHGTTDSLINTILSGFQGGKTHEKEGALKADENAIFSIFSLAGAAAVLLFKSFGVDLAGGALSSITTFYASIYMLKIMLRFLVPMVMMTIYLGWGIYMIIGELRGSTIIRGMILIFSVSIIFGLWAIADHIDDKLWDAMYGSRWGSPFAMIILDATSGIFYIAISSIVFYKINLAGGGDAGKSIGGSQQQASGLSRDLGGRFSGGIGKFGKSFGKWMFGGTRDKAGNLVSGGYGARAWDGLKNGYRRMKDFIRK